MKASNSLSALRATIRQDKRQARNALGPHQAQQANQLALNKIRHHPWFARARRIGIYLGGDGELDPRDLVHLKHKQLFLPKLTENRRQAMIFAAYHYDSPMLENRYGIAEPVTTELVMPQDLDLVFMPLVAFDTQGNRLGMGGGFYDRSFAFLRQRKRWAHPRLIGLAHDCQEHSQLPIEHWDVPLNGIITPTRSLRFT